ncbi:MAG: DUF3999 domain-containing protein [Gammaproteobacteria bacterium]|nr:DUF3999 domain-containing protein [Gammaproteobacteria bacterium]MDH3857380.1 DUF3999 domain-containing protein [Gammaproteobacteria bacterium]
MRKLLYPLIILLWIGSAQSQAIPEDYAYKARLGESEQTLQRVELPIDVILAVTRSDLADLAVFNFRDEPIPHALTHRPKTVIEHRPELPFHEFDRYLQQNSKTVTTRQQNQQENSLSELETTETVAVQSVRKDYLIELSVDGEIPRFDRIELTWNHEPAGQLLEVRVEAGNELDKLRVIKSRKSLTNQESKDLDWRSIKGIPRNKKYLRLTPVNEVTSFELQSVRGHYREIEEAPALTYPIEPGVTEEDTGRFYTFEFPSVVRAQAMRIAPTDANRVIKGDLYGIWGKNESRQPIRSGYRQHNLRADDVKPSKPIGLPSRGYKSIWFTTQADLIEAPRVELIYPKYEVIFLGDDNGPYTLAWGNHEIKGPTTDLTGILKGSLKQAQHQSTLVTIDAIQESGGSSRLAPQPALPWKKWLLWTLLILAAIVTGRMALKLYHEMIYA